MRTSPDFFTAAWALLQRGAADKRHAFNLATLSTLQRRTPANDLADAVPRARTIVLRKASREQFSLLGYTDARSGKVADIEAAADAVSWCFWDRKSRIQVYAAGHTVIDRGPAAAAVFNSLPKHSRKAYATRDAPGATRSAPGDGLPDNWEELKLEGTNYARANFCLLRTAVTRMEILELGRDGHVRMRSSRTDRTPWRHQWVVP